jgi:hypothetical protein
MQFYRIYLFVPRVHQRLTVLYIFHGGPTKPPSEEEKKDKRNHVNRISKCGLNDEMWIDR